MSHSNSRRSVFLCEKKGEIWNQLMDKIIYNLVSNPHPKSGEDPGISISKDGKKKSGHVIYESFATIQIGHGMCQTN